MILRLSVILSILLTQNLFANEDFITLKGINVATPYGKVESILSERGYECDTEKTVLDDGTTFPTSWCFQGDEKLISVDYLTNAFIGYDDQYTSVNTVYEIGIDCESLNACGRNKEFIDLLVGKYKLIYMTKTDIGNYNKYNDYSDLKPYLTYDDQFEYYRNPNNNDVLFYNAKTDYYFIVPYKYESEKLKKMRKRNKKQLKAPFDID